MSEITPQKRKLKSQVNTLAPRKKKRKLNLKYSKEFVPSTKKIETVSDLIKCIKEWKAQYDPCRRELTYSDIEYEKLSKILPELRRLNKLVGMDDLKRSIVEQIIYFVQNLHNKEMMNLVLTGEPGTGKSTVGMVLSKIYSKLGILSDRASFTCANRSDLIAGYLGQTAKKTLKFLESCKGGVIFIDEAYSLGHDPDDRDSFSKECLNTLNQFLSENTDTICILAGYEDALENNIFSMNPGLRRRFPWKFNMKKYTPEELQQIFLYRVKKDKWTIEDNINIAQFFSNKKNFKNNGGDCEIFLNRCKIEHGKRIFTLTQEDKKEQRFKLTLEDVKKGYELFINENKNRKQNDLEPNNLMYL